MSSTSITVRSSICVSHLGCDRRDPQHRRPGGRGLLRRLSGCRAHLRPGAHASASLTRVIEEAERQPGIVLFTIADRTLRGRLESRLNTLGIPCSSIFDPAIPRLAAYLKAESRPHIGGQHVLDAHISSASKRSTTRCCTMTASILKIFDKAEVVLIGISRSQDADQHLSRQPRHSHRQHPAGPGTRAAARASQA